MGKSMQSHITYQTKLTPKMFFLWPTVCQKFGNSCASFHSRCVSIYHDKDIK